MNNVRVTLSIDADSFLADCTPTVRDHLVKVIRDKAQAADQQMPVLSWTCDGNYPHIERAMKDYRFRPGIRILFHITRHKESIHIDRIAWRDCDPYADGN
jgi:hypothetical protein